MLVRVKDQVLRAFDSLGSRLVLLTRFLGLESERLDDLESLLPGILFREPYGAAVSRFMSSSTTRKVREPVWFAGRNSLKEVRTAFFHAWELTRARRTPPYRADFGDPVSSRLTLDGGTLWMTWMST